jgi:hypothetical protein
MAGRLQSVQVNRAPVLTLWASVVAERLGYCRATALTLGKAVAGLNAQSKGRHLGLFKELEPGARKKAAGALPPARHVPLLGRSVPVVNTPQGLCAVANDRGLQPEAVERYLVQKFGEALDDARAAMRELARSYPPTTLAEKAYSLYEKFRPRIPEGTRGWGASGTLDFELIRSLARRTNSR